MGSVYKTIFPKITRVNQTQTWLNQFYDSVLVFAGYNQPTFYILSPMRMDIVTPKKQSALS